MQQHTAEDIAALAELIAELRGHDTAAESARDAAEYCAGVRSKFTACVRDGPIGLPGVRLGLIDLHEDWTSRDAKGVTVTPATAAMAGLGLRRAKGDRSRPLPGPAHAVLHAYLAERLELLERAARFVPMMQRAYHLLDVRHYGSLARAEIAMAELPAASTETAKAAA